MKRNYIPSLFFIAFLFIFLLGCNSNSQVSNPSDDARILSIAIQKNDSSPNANSAVFTINHDDSIIFNVDSLPYGTKIDSLHISFTFASTAGFIINDTVPESPNFTYYGTSNTGTTSTKVDFSQPVTVKNLASDGKTSRNYTIDLRVHQVETYLHDWVELNTAVNPAATENQKALFLNNKFYYFFGNVTENTLYTSDDAATWTAAGTAQNLPAGIVLRNIVAFNNNMLLLHNGNEIYKSNDGITWSKEILAFDTNYDLKSLLFSFKERIWAVAQHKSTQKVRIASSLNGSDWSLEEKREFTDFPIDDFSAIKFRPAIGREKVLVTGGRDASGTVLNTLWSAENIIGIDTLYWVNLQHKNFKLEPIYRAATAYYGSKVLMFGGANSLHQPADTLYQLAQSIDEGLTWLMPDSTQNQMPENYAFRSNASIIHDEANYTLYLLGGQSKSTPLSDVWKIKVNFYSFDDFFENPKKY